MKKIKMILACALALMLPLQITNFSSVTGTAWGGKPNEFTKFCGQPVPWDSKNSKLFSMYLNRLSKHRSYYDKVVFDGLAYEEEIKFMLEERGLPEDLFYVIGVESGFSADAKSPQGALGLWQFMPYTAKYYGLTVGARDQRIDWAKSTDAACKYYSDLYKYYGDWYLSMAAYNCGGCVMEHKNKNYFDIKNLNPETASYVYKIIAFKWFYESRKKTLQAENNGLENMFTLKINQ